MNEGVMIIMMNLGSLVPLCKDPVILVYRIKKAGNR